MKKEKKTGIYKSETDELQPWRVFWKGYIIWFARTEEEAKVKLLKAELGEHSLKSPRG